MSDFDRWIQEHYEELRIELTLRGRLNEDALHEAYISTRKQVEAGDSIDFAAAFTEAYRKAARRDIGEAMRTLHLDSDVPAPAERPTPTTINFELARAIDQYLDGIIGKGKAAVFRLVMAGMTMRQAAQATGTSASTCCRAMRETRETIKRTYHYITLPT